MAYQGHGTPNSILRWFGRIVVFCCGGDASGPDAVVDQFLSKVSEAQRRSRLLPGLEVVRDRMEEADRGFFERVEEGYKNWLTPKTRHVRSIDATASREEVTRQIWASVDALWRKTWKIPPKTDKNTAVDKAAASGPLALQRRN